jgi:hypothetical protein
MISLGPANKMTILAESRLFVRTNTQSWTLWGIMLSAIFLLKIKSPNLFQLLSLKGSMEDQCEKSKEGQGAFTTGCPAFSPPRKVPFLV